MKNLDSSIRNKLLLILETKAVPEQEVQDCLHLIDIGRGQIIEELHRGSMEAVSVLVQYQQRTLTELLNLLVLQLDRASAQADHPGQATLEKLKDAMHAALVYIRQYFHQFFNADLDMPILELRAARKALDAQLGSIKKKLHSIDTAGLLRIALEPIAAFIDNEDARISYNKLQYFETYTAELLKIQSSGDLNCDIRIVMGFMGFNSKDFLQYMADIIDQEILTLASTEEKLERLALRVKQIKQIQTKVDLRLYDDMPCASAYMTAYINEEIAYLQSRQTFITVADPPQQSNGQSPDKKIQTSLNVSTLAALLKVQVTAGIINNKVLEDVLRIIAAHYCTDKKEEIRYTSLRTLYNNVEIRTGQQVIDICHSLLNTARHLYR